MPVYNLNLHLREQNFCQRDGPLLQVSIQTPASAAAVLTRAGKDIPAPVLGFALIDTGANVSAVHENVLKGLGCTPIDRIFLNSAHGGQHSDVYMASIAFPTLRGAQVLNQAVAGCNLDWDVTNDNEKIIMLIGRDMLRRNLLVYDGVNGHVTLCF